MYIGMRYRNLDIGGKKEKNDDDEGIIKNFWKDFMNDNLNILSCHIREFFLGIL